jgi:AcrR family transcriptional regulator
MDGRSLRRERNRELAVDALLDLLGEGVTRPTGQQVAERSGISLRSIFRIFEDVETLHAVAVERQLERIRPLFVAVDVHGDVDRRIDAVVSAHARIYEAIAPVRRAAVRAAPESPPLRDHLDWSRRWFRAQLERVFAPERPDATTLSAVELALSWEAWDQLRSAQALSATRARRAVTRTLTALLIT